LLVVVTGLRISEQYRIIEHRFESGTGHFFDIH